VGEGEKGGSGSILNLKNRQNQEIVDRVLNDGTREKRHEKNPHTMSGKRRALRKERRGKREITKSQGDVVLVAKGDRECPQRGPKARKKRGWIYRKKRGRVVPLGGKSLSVKLWTRKGFNGCVHRRTY